MNSVKMITDIGAGAVNLMNEGTIIDKVEKGWESHIFWYKS